MNGMRNTKLAFLAVAALLFLSAGCGKKKKQADTGKPGPEAPPAPAAAAVEVTAAAAEAKVVVLSDRTFNATVGEGVVLVDFWAPWCPPCKMQGPIIKTLAPKFAGRAKVCKLNVDEGSETSERFGIRAIPTLIVFKDGEKHKQFIGLTEEGELSAALEEALK